MTIELLGSGGIKFEFFFDGSVWIGYDAIESFSLDILGDFVVTLVNSDVLMSLSSDLNWLMFEKLFEDVSWTTYDGIELVSSSWFVSIFSSLLSGSIFISSFESSEQG